MYDLNTPSGVLEHVQNNCVSMVEFIGILPIFLCCLSGRNKDVLQLKLITFIKAIILEFEAKYPLVKWSMLYLRDAHTIIKNGGSDKYHTYRQLLL